MKGFADEEDGILLYKGGEFKNFSCSVRVKPVNREGSLILRALDTKKLLSFDIFTRRSK